MDIPAGTLAALERGTLSSATHAEHMAVNQRTLWSRVFPDLAVPAFESLGFIDRLRLGGQTLHGKCGPAAWEADNAEPDTVTAWRAFAVAAANLPIREKLKLIEPFALSEHFAIREWAWLALRPEAVAQPFTMIKELEHSITGSPANWRRFASEVTRPRSVWGRHIPALKQRPQCAETLLAPFLLDDSVYVVTSATNWLNDVCGDHLDWVRSMCATYGGIRSDPLVRRSTRSYRRETS